MKSKKIFSGRFFLVWMLALGLVAVTNSCKKNSDDNQPASPPANEVWMQGNSFTPSSITVSVNTTVTWRNKDSVNHTVTSNTGSELNSGTVSGSGTFSHQFTAAGTYSYHCNFHSGMAGTVVVH